MQNILRRSWSSGVKACSSIRRYGFILSRFRNTRQTVGCGMPSSLPPLAVDFLGLYRKASLICSIISDTEGRPLPLPLHMHPVLRNLSYHLRMKLSEGRFFLNLMRECRWTAVTDRLWWKSRTQNTFCSLVSAILHTLSPYSQMHKLLDGGQYKTKLCVFLYPLVWLK